MTVSLSSRRVVSALCGGKNPTPRLYGVGLEKHAPMHRSRSAGKCRGHRDKMGHRSSEFVIQVRKSNIVTDRLSKLSLGNIRGNSNISRLIGIRFAINIIVPHINIEHVDLSYRAWTPPSGRIRNLRTKTRSSSSRTAREPTCTQSTTTGKVTKEV